MTGKSFDITLQYEARILWKILTIVLEQFTYAAAV